MVVQFKQKTLDRGSPASIELRSRNLDEIYSQIARTEEKYQREKFTNLIQGAQLQGVQDVSKYYDKAVKGTVLYISKLQARMFHSIEQEGHTKDLIKNWGPIVLVGLAAFIILEINNNPTLKDSIANLLSDRINVLVGMLLGTIGFIAFLRYRGNAKKGKGATA